MAITHAEHDLETEVWGDALPADAERGPQTILVVDDEPTVRSFTSEVLALEGYTVIEASSAAEGLRIAAEHPGPIHLVISDVVLPESDGPELVAQLERRRPTIAPLYISGHTESDVRRRGSVDAAFLQKPFTMDVLVDMVRAVLHGARGRAASA